MVEHVTPTPQNSSSPLKKGSVGGGWLEASGIMSSLASIESQIYLDGWPVPTSTIETQKQAGTNTNLVPAHSCHTMIP